ncbi:MAG: hypothetical protein ABI599_02045 [Flavobacteriales bacterium]
MERQTLWKALMHPFLLGRKAGMEVLLLFLPLLLCSCTKELSYELNPVELQPPGTIKDQEKTNQQYAAILYANLFQDAMSANELYELDQCIQSIGDKELAREVIISNFMNKPGVIIPDEAAMRADIDAFVIETYNRFLVRQPTEAEKTWFRNYIEADPNVTPEIIYFSFAMSDEYLFY